MKSNLKKMYKNWMIDIDVTPEQMEFLLENYGDESSIIAIHNTIFDYPSFFEKGLENYTSLYKKTNDLSNTVNYCNSLVGLMSYPNGDGQCRGKTAIVLKIPRDVFEHKQGIFETLKDGKYGIPPQFIKAAFTNGKVIKNKKYDSSYINENAQMCKDRKKINYRDDDKEVFKKVYYKNFRKKQLAKKLKNLFSIRKKQHLLNVANSEKIDATNNDNMILDVKEDTYKDLINNEQIEKIIRDIPNNLSEIEKAYYIYLELGKILKEDPSFVFSNFDEKKKHYNDSIDNNYNGICKSISELYVSILKDKRIGVDAELVKKDIGSPITHIDTILKIGGKNYICNLISDLYRIKTSRKVHGFCFELNEPKQNKTLEQNNKLYKERLENYYGKIDSLSKEQIEELDKKMDYSFFIPKFMTNTKGGIYAEDTIAMLKKEMENPELFKRYVLHNQDVPKEDWLKHKLDYIFENQKAIIENNNQGGYLENVRNLINIAMKLLTKEDGQRIQSYVATVNNDMSNIISILKVNSLRKKEDGNNSYYYYLYSNKDKTYKNKTPKEMKQFIDGLDKNSLDIIGEFDRYGIKKVDISKEIEL